MLEASLRILFSIMFCLMSSLGFAAKLLPVTPAKTITMTDPGKTIMVARQAPTVTITLSSNATTGFSWFLGSPLSGLIEPVSDQYHAPSNHLIGAPGYETWTFKLKKAAFVVPTILTIPLIYTRAFDAKGAKPLFFTLSTHA
jgi:inhibitor of cysteine peptidase